MANDWKITTKDAGLIGGVAEGSEEELSKRLDALNDFYTKGVAKIERAYKSSFISAKSKRKGEIIVKPTRDK